MAAEPLTILFVAPRYHTNQVWSVRALKQAGHRVEYLVLYCGATEEHADVKPTVVGLNWLGKRLVQWKSKGRDPMLVTQIWGLPRLSELRRYLRDLNPDVIVARGPAMPLSILSFIWGRLHRKHLIMYTQGGLVLTPPWKERAKAFFLALFRAAWMSPVRNPGDETRPAHPRMFYVPFVAPPLDPTPPSRPRTPVRVLTVGKYEPRKNHLLLLEAMEPILRSGQATLTMVGEASTDARRQLLEQIQQAVQQKGLTGCVSVKANLPFSEMPGIYRDADLFVLPARAEPAAVSILEAMSFGLPSICSTTNGTKCYIRDGVNGYVFESDNMESLRAKLRPAIEDPGLLRQLSQGAAEAAAGEFSATAYLRHLEEMLQSLT